VKERRGGGEWWKEDTWGTLSEKFVPPLYHVEGNCALQRCSVYGYHGYMDRRPNAVFLLCSAFLLVADIFDYFPATKIK